jgi:RNA polymerase sigma-70 factor (sigma-E family)
MRATDKAEYTEFAAATGRRLRRTAYLMCGDWHRAEDAAQDALLRVYRRWTKLNRTTGLTTYAHRAVVSAVLDQAKRPWRREHSTAATTDPSTTPEPGSAVDNRLLVIQALAAVPPGQRACVVLRYYADLSITDTAEILGISPGAVKSQTSSGLGRLRELLGSDERIHL